MLGGSGSGLITSQRLTDGNFVNTTGWTTVSCTIAASNNILTMTGNGAGSTPYIIKNTSDIVYTGQKLFLMGIIKLLSASCTGISIRAGNNTGTAITSISNPVLNQQYSLSGIWTVTSANNGTYAQIRAASTYIDSATANGMAITVQNMMIFDLTGMFGAGREPSAASFLSVIQSAPAYFEGQFIL